MLLRENAEDKLFGKLGEVKKAKKENNAIIAIGGCMMQEEHILEKLNKSYPYVDIIFGTHTLHKLPEDVYKILEGTNKKIEDVLDIDGKIYEDLPIKRVDNIKAQVTIMYGCNNYCTYCIVPYVRGRERSRKAEDILKEVNIEEKELNKVNRFFEIEEFRKIKKKLLKNNKEDFGIVQGSPISAVLSNIYMIKFDSLINNLITSHNGIYRRYSDDIFIAVPNIEQGKQICNQIKDLVDSIPNLKLSEKKTKYFVKYDDSFAELNKDNLEITNKKARLDYLGFSYDGNKIKIIEKTVSKFYTKMYARVKTINRYSNKLNRNIGRRKIYKQYSHLGANTKKVKEGNFLSYVNRAKDVFKEDAEFDKQVRNAWKNLNKKLDNVNSKRGE